MVDCFVSREHIPGAVYMNIFEAEHNDNFPRNLPKAKTIEEKARAAGINKDTHVVVYSDSAFCGFFIGGRGWWTLKLFSHTQVSVLDGGLAKWKSCEYPLTNAVVPTKTGNFTSKWDGVLYRSYEDVLGNVKSNKFQLVDCRPAAAFNGEEGCLGHIKGAKNIQLGLVINQDKLELKSTDELKEVFSKAGVDVKKPMVCHCVSGLASCTVTIAAMLCGSKNIAIYHGGYSEWKNRSPDLLVK
ncbi:thiosulfate sulfurtransferase-like [Gigantopelta aegis]|uniref:thiosulfate sulfurtransferase-like n=1 Tax=Gigantopelta aegis TaxID=1735272 RepID=UPI001B8893DF|nr:thiosulfate sulfurtransferase-like [Gigantopelta aegis]